MEGVPNVNIVEVVCGYIHSSSRSSTTNRRFGGIQGGWIELRSIPVTEADGYLSATVNPFSGWPSALGATLLGSYSLSIAHMPVPVPSGTVSEA